MSLLPLCVALDPWAEGAARRMYPQRHPHFSLLAYRDPNLAERYRKHLNKIQAEDVPIDIKPVNPPDVYCSEPQEPKQLFWVRARGYIGGSCQEWAV